MLKITRQVTLLLLAGALSFPAYSYATQVTEVLVPEVTQEKVTGTVKMHWVRLLVPVSW